MGKDVFCLALKSKINKPDWLKFNNTMKSKILKNKLEALLAEKDELAKKESMTAEDKSRWSEIEKIEKTLNEEIALEESKESYLRARAASNGFEVSRQESNDIQKYSIVKAIRELLHGGNLTGIEKEMSDEAVREMGSISAITGIGISSKILMHKTVTRAVLGASGSPVVPITIGNFIDAVWAKTIVVNFGAQTMSGLAGNVDLPYFSTKPTVKWDAENDDASDAGAALDKVSLRPKRLTNYVPLSKLLLVQESVDVERKVWDALINATAVQLQRAALHGAVDGPTGLASTDGIGSVVGGTNGLAPTLSHVLQLIREVAIDDADFGALGFITSPKVRYKLMSTAIETGHPERVWNVLQPDMLVGYKAGVTTLVSDTLDKGTSTGVCSAIFFGNWNKMVLAQFGALDLLADPYTPSLKHQVNLVLNAFYDVGIEYPGAFSAMKDALTT